MEFSQACLQFLQRKAREGADGVTQMGELFEENEAIHLFLIVLAPACGRAVGSVNEISSLPRANGVRR